MANQETGENIANYSYWVDDKYNKVQAKKDLEKLLDELKNIYYPEQYAQSGYKEIYKSNSYIIYKVDTFAASFYLGKATGWCTSGRYGGSGPESINRVHP